MPRDAAGAEAKCDLWGVRLQCQRGLGEVLQPVLMHPLALSPHLAAIMPPFPILEHSSLSFLTIPAMVDRCHNAPQIPAGWWGHSTPTLVPFQSVRLEPSASVGRCSDLLASVPSLWETWVNLQVALLPRQHSLSLPISTVLLSGKPWAKCGQGSRGLKGGEEMPAPSTFERDGPVETPAV